jgi:phosphatidylserine/phosphatidylglycerophosphate/cardiolipin synthase-like enzyme
MRQKNTNGAVSVHAIAGTNVVLFGIDINKTKTDGLLGFAIQRTVNGVSNWLPNFLLFKANDVGQMPDHGSNKNPFQAFVWGDYTAQPGTQYTYNIVAKYGSANNLTDGDTVTVDIKTEDQKAGTHAIFFNRGVAGSQAYAMRFHNEPPSEVPNNEAYAWLSRGLEEAMIAFISQANTAEWSIRASVYEFTWDRALQAFKNAADKGADVKIIYDAIKDMPRKEDEKSIADNGLTGVVIPRKNSHYISHNKFIVLLKNGNPVQVWTGSTNITDSGIFAQSNVGHQVRDGVVAAKYLDYWTELSQDPDAKSLKDWQDQNDPTPNGQVSPGSITPIFSPRHNLDALQWYADQAKAANTGLFLTAPFGVNQKLADVYESPAPFLRYILLDKMDASVDVINRDPSNRVTAGAYLGEGQWGQWLQEKLTGLSEHVQYIHTKYMLIDPLGDDPLVITGSANFSNASTESNDENTIVIRGDTTVADIYLTEFMRLFTHFYFRSVTAKQGADLAPGPTTPRDAVSSKIYLDESGNWVKPYFTDGDPKQRERDYFSGRMLVPAGTSS